MIRTYIDRVEDAIKVANTSHSKKPKTKLTEFELTMIGMSARKNRIFLNELIKPDTRYLEVGVFKGSTFVSALYGNTPEYAVAVDNFTQFDEQGKNLEIFKEATIEHGIKDFTLLNADCFNIPPNLQDYVLNKGFNTYFYDGGHTEDDQYRALYYYYMTLASVFIYMCDDWNMVEAQVGTKRAQTDLKLTIHKEWELPAEYNGDLKGWWNGLYVAVCEKTQ